MDDELRNVGDQDPTGLVLIRILMSTPESAPKDSFTSAVMQGIVSAEDLESNIVFDYSISSVTSRDDE